MITNVDSSLSISADTIEVKFSEDDQNWFDSVEFDGLRLEGKVEPVGEDDYKITFTTQGGI